MRVRFARSRLVIYAAAALVAAVGTFWPTPYSLIVPGQAQELSRVISVGGRPAPPVRLYLTDVSLVTSAPPFALLDRFAPGVRVVRTDAILPAGIDAARFERMMREDMTQSQDAAAYVAERAAGLAVPPPHLRVVVRAIFPGSRSGLRDGDVLLSVGGTSVATAAGLHAALAHVAAGAVVPVAYLRSGTRRVARIATIGFKGRAALGVYVEERERLPKLPVPVRFRLPGVSGSSGGLMFALQIYATLRPSKVPEGAVVAGTGTLDSDGAVGEIAGTAQKLVAARRAGARVFLVPVANAAEIRGARGIRVIAVRTFGDALEALATAGSGPGRS